MKIKLFTAFLIVILIVAGFCGCIDLVSEKPGPEVKEYFEDEYLATNNTVLSFSTVNGAISVSSWDGVNITLNATKRSRYGYDDLKNAEIIVSENNNEITIEIQHVQPIRSRAVDLDIKIPYNVTVKSASSINGPIQITNTKGNTVFSTTNGAIIAEGIDGYVKASTTNGGIDIKSTTGVGDLTTTNGGISAEIFDIKDDIDIQSTNGGITVYINPTINVSIEITTTNGDISAYDSIISVTESSSKYLKGTIGNGGNKINIKTTNGGIKVFKLEIL